MFRKETSLSINLQMQNILHKYKSVFKVRISTNVICICAIYLERYDFSSEFARECKYVQRNVSGRNFRNYELILIMNSS